MGADLCKAVSAGLVMNVASVASRNHERNALTLKRQLRTAGSTATGRTVAHMYNHRQHPLAARVGPSHRSRQAACCHRQRSAGRSGQARSHSWSHSSTSETVRHAPTEDGQPRSRTLLTFAGLSCADLESVWPADADDLHTRASRRVQQRGRATRTRYGHPRQASTYAPSCTV